MEEVRQRIQQKPCLIRRVRWSRARLRCDRCQQAAPRVWETLRTAIDIDLAQPVLLGVVISVHHCRPCRRHFRAQPPFLRPDAIYTNRVVRKAVEAVYEDGLALRRVARRLARDFWVQPSEKMIRLWCQTYAAGLDFEHDYLPWVVETFSGVLCVDEVYQGKLALLLAVDPAAPDGDRLVGYQLVQGTVDQARVGSFLRRLKAAGIEPEQVITDGSALYPTLLAQVWPTAAHQLCLFHETRRVTAAVDEVAKAVRSQVPKPPPARPPTLAGRPRQVIPAAEATDSATQRWRWREGRRQAGRRQAQELRQRGLSVRAIARQTGLNRRTVTKWLQQPAPAGLVEGAAPEHLAGDVPLPPEPPPPPPWASWDEVRQFRADLKKARPLLLRRPDHLTPEDQGRLDRVLTSAVGADLQTARTFAIEWYDIWRDEAGQRRSLGEARQRYEQWRDNSASARLAPLRRAQQSVDEARFVRLSQFLTQAHWEATNNGAERTGRTFRHGQRPHFNLRTVPAISDDLKVRACLRKRTMTELLPRPSNRSSRGRRPHHRARPMAAA